SKARMGRLNFAPGKEGAERQTEGLLNTPDSEVLSHTDSLQFIRQGLIENPDTLRYPNLPADSVNLGGNMPPGSK
ncbi:MAG: hypothetical protein K2L78_04535, partial [Muribaculaceae bacterium]|nr:hypothetical protein [Muribaculaceae bacterium]